MNYVNIEVDQGCSYVLELEYTNDVTGIPIDLTGYSGKFSIVPIPNQPPAFSLTEADTDFVLGGVTGKVTVYIRPEVTLSTTWYQAPYDVILLDPLGVKVKICRGLVTINPSESV